MKKLAFVLASLTLATSALADNYAIVGGQVHTMGSKGTIEKGTVLIKDGRIES